MPKISKISAQEIDSALQDATRQYLVGDLQKPQSLKHVPSSLIEIGITRYENEAKLNSSGNILLLRRKDNDKWTMPGGTLDFGESLTHCAIREVREETGLQIQITGLIGTYTDPHILIAYSDGEVRQEFTFVYAAEIESGGLKIDADLSGHLRCRHAVKPNKLAKALNQHIDFLEVVL
jgi:ADP-ribose pyrophosphatase YjhB (NUDIX family)